MKSFSTHQVRNLGKTIREEGRDTSDQTLEHLQKYRTTYKSIISSVFEVLCEEAQKVSKQPLTVYRVKRIESIVGKLDRYPSMKLDRMWDIAGCRCILRSNQEVEKLTKRLHGVLKIRKVNNYVKTPQLDGYKAIHLYVTIGDQNQVVEIQLRNLVQHNWATLVEISDFLYGTNIKEGGSETQLSRMHLLLQRKESLNIEQKKEVMRIIRKYKYFEKLNSVFSRNYLRVREQWMEIESTPSHNYFLIEAFKDSAPIIQSFQSYPKAEENYYEKVRSGRDSNVLLTRLQNPSYNQISQAYSNYILTMHAFTDECYNLLETLVIDSIRTRRLFKFISHLRRWARYQYIHTRSILHEMDVLNTFAESKEEPIRRNYKSWASDIQANLDRRKRQIVKLKKNMEQNPVSSLFVFYFVNIIVSITNYWYDFRMKYRRSRR